MDRYTVRERLKNGTEVTVRAVRPDDGPRIRRAFTGLDRDTVYSRFFSYKASVSDEELRRITGCDFKRDVALLVTIGSGEEEIVIGGASYFALDTQPGEQCAELAFTVVNDYQGLGVGTCLIQHLIGIAREKGVTRLQADVLARNLPMLEVLRHSGVAITVRHEAEVAHVALEIQKTQSLHP